MNVQSAYCSRFRKFHFSPTVVVALESSGVVKVLGQNCAGSLYGSLAHSVEGSRKGAPRFHQVHQVSRCLCCFGAGSQKVPS